jgi:hypothetical protein
LSSAAFIGEAPSGHASNPGWQAVWTSDMADPPKTHEVQIQIQLDDDVANGHYVNMALVNHTETEFTLDFVYVQPQQPKAKVRSRIITSPKHMKRLLAAIQDNVSKYEAKHGVIQLLEQETPVH